MIYSVRFRLFNVADRPVFKPVKCKPRRRSIMNSINLNNKIIIYCIIFLCTLGAHAATSGQTKAEDSEPEMSEMAKLMHRATTAAKERRAEKNYEKRNAQITPWAEDTAPPNPDNAALLYYQAFLLRPEANLAITRKLEGVLTGAESDRQVRTYLGHCLPMIKITETASRMPQCNWGTWHEPGVIFNKIGWTNEIRYLTLIQFADARTLAADGHYRAALEGCLTLRRFARHLGEDLSENPKLYFHSLNTDRRALKMVRHVLGMIPPDEDILNWFQGQLAFMQAQPASFTEMLQADFKSFFNGMLMNPTRLAKLNNEFIEKAEDEQAKENVRNLTDEQILSRARKPFLRLLNSIFRVIDSEMTYEQKCSQIQRLVDKLKAEHGDDPVVAHIISISGIGSIIKPPMCQYPFYVGHQAHINAVKTAVELYLVVVKTGQLPKTLPPGLPKDPYTGRDFEYEITENGFTLRCGVENCRHGIIEQYEFKVKTKN